MGLKSSRESFRPLPRDTIMFLAILQVQRGDAANERVARVTVCEKRTYREEHFGNGESRRPVVFEDIQTYVTLTVDVTMINTGLECYLKKQRKQWLTKYVQRTKYQWKKMC